MRAKVDLVRGGRGSGRARERIEQAVRLGWQARGPRLIAVCGPPASGKSTLARELCAQSAMAHLSYDVVRKARAGLPATERAPATAYEHEATLATYRELGERAAGRRWRPGTARSSTPRSATGRRAMRCATGWGRRRRSCAAWSAACPRPRRRAARALAERDAGRESDATAEVAARLATAWAALDEVPADRHLVVRADRPAGEVARDVAAWLDRAWV